jgi:hypothetical protein
VVLDEDGGVIRTRAAIGALSDDEFPTLLESAGELAAALADDAEFDYGLDRLFDALEARAGVRAR